MMRFWFHDYTLVPEQSLNAVAGKQTRVGALLKMQWADGKVGYTDLSPWPELGEQPVSHHLQEIRQGHITPLVEHCIWLAKRDAGLRAVGKNAFVDLPKIKNHFLIPDYTICADSMLRKAESDGFTSLKMKVGRDWADEIKWISRALQGYSFNLRLDFNAKGSFADLESLASKLPIGIKRKLDYVEDPFPYDEAGWTEAGKFAPLALDLEYDKVNWTELQTKDSKVLPFSYIVLKPARQNLSKALPLIEAGHLKVSVTSNMDHPVGVAHALLVAGELKKKWSVQVMDCGLLTNRLFAPNEFASQMLTQGNVITQVAGTGIGFDSLFEKLKWRELKVMQ